MSFLSGKAPQISNPTSFTPAGFSSPGISGSYAGGSYNITQGAGLSSAIGGLQRTFGQEATAFGALGATVTPGFSQFRQAGLSDLTTQQQASRSNLQDNLAQRRIMGSSFANAQQTQQDAEFAAQRDKFIAQSYMQELQASNQIIHEQFQAKSQQFSTGINEFNLEAGIAADLSAKATSSMAQVAQAQAQLDAQAQAGVGSFFGALSSAAIGAAGNIFKGPASVTNVGMGGGSAAGTASAFTTGASPVPYLRGS